MSKIFLSYSSADLELAEQIRAQIRNEIPRIEVFLARYSISSSQTWFDELKSNLKTADALVLLLTPTSEKSAWVIFEYGYFYSMKDGKNIHILCHPTAAMPSPLGHIQSSFVTDVKDLDNFFEMLCKNVGHDYQHKADLNAILSTTNNMNFESSADRDRKQQLIQAMSSIQPTTSIPAVEELKNRRWLSDGTLCGQDFSGANLEKAPLKSARLQDADFRSSILNGADLRLCELQNAKFESAHLQEANFFNAKLFGVNFFDAEMQGVILGNADLRSTILLRAILKNADLRNADMDGATLLGAQLQGARLQDANLKGAKINNTTGFDETTRLPDGEPWTSNTDMNKFTDPDHPEFWRSDNIKSPAN